MKKSIQVIVLDGGTNNSQKKEVFKGSKLYKAGYENNILTLRFEIGATMETEHRHFAVYDSRQSIPDKFLPAIAEVNGEGVTLFILDVTHDRVSFNERKNDLVSFGNWILSKYGVRKPISTDPTATEAAHINNVDLENWKHSRMGIMDVED